MATKPPAKSLVSAKDPLRINIETVEVRFFHNGTLLASGLDLYVPRRDDDVTIRGTALKVKSVEHDLEQRTIDVHLMLWENKR